MRLIGVPSSARHVDRGNASRQQLDRRLGSSDLLDHPSGQPRHPRKAPFHRARGQALDVAVQRCRRNRVVHQQTVSNEPVDEDIGVVVSRKLPCGPVEPARRGCRRRQRQRPVHQLARQQRRHEAADAELDAEELGVFRDGHGGCLRLRPSHRQPSRAPLPRDDHLPMDRRHRDERLLRLTSRPPRLVDEGRARRSPVECEQLDGAFMPLRRVAVGELIGRQRGLRRVGRAESSTSRHTRVTPPCRRRQSGRHRTQRGINT